MPAPSPGSRGWKIATAIALVAFVAFYIWTMTFRFHNAMTPYALHGDQQQSIGHYWRYAVDGAIPPGHLLTDYAQTYHSSPLWWLIMASMSALIGPLSSAKILGLLAYLLFAVGAVIVVGRRTEWVLGLLTGIMLLRNPPDAVEQITGGMARSMGPFLVFLFLWAFMEGRHRLVLAILVVQAGVYPSVVIPCGICYGVYVVVKGPMRDRLRRCAGMFVAGLLIIAFGMAQNFSSPKWWGPPVTYTEAEQMPAWRAGGRFPDVPHRPLDTILQYNIERPFKQLGARPAPKEAERFVGHHTFGVFFAGPIALSLLMMAVGFGRRALQRRRLRRAASAAVTPPETSPGEQDGASTTAEAPATSPPNELPALPPFDWHTIALFMATVAAWFVVKTLAFRLFLPSRQIGFVIPYIVITFLPILVWYASRVLFPGRRVVAVVITVLVTLVPVFVFRGHGGEATGSGYSQHDRDGKYIEAIRKLPLDQEIACDLQWCEYMIALGQHAPYAARSLSHPLRKGYYEEAERRLVEMFGVLYATRVEEIETFIQKENVHFMVYRSGETQTMTKRLYNPATQRVTERFRAGGKRPRLLNKPPKASIVFQDGDRLIVDLDKLVVALKAAPPTPEVQEAPADDGALDDKVQKPVLPQRLKGLLRGANPDVRDAAAPDEGVFD
jgi:hypothetical protein